MPGLGIHKDKKPSGSGNGLFWVMWLVFFLGFILFIGFFPVARSLQDTQNLCDKNDSSCYNASLKGPDCTQDKAGMGLVCHLSTWSCRAIYCISGPGDRTDPSQCCDSPAGGKGGSGGLIGRIYQICPVECKKSVVLGRVSLKEGNCMPPIVYPICNISSISTQVAAFTKVKQTDMNEFSYRATTTPVKTVLSTANGTYELKLPPGEYSVFARDPKTGNYYCNSFNEKGFACNIQVNETPCEYDIIIDDSSQ